MHIVGASSSNGFKSVQDMGKGVPVVNGAEAFDIFEYKHGWSVCFDVVDASLEDVPTRVVEAPALVVGSGKGLAGETCYV